MPTPRPSDLRERTFRFSCEIVAFSGPLLDRGVTARLLSTQLVRAGTSIGANAEEAVAAYSRREFAVKNAIALKEAREVRYWLRLIVASGVSDERAVRPLLAESNELVFILTSVVRTARANAAAISGSKRDAKRGT